MDFLSRLVRTRESAVESKADRHAVSRVRCLIEGDAPDVHATAAAAVADSDHAILVREFARSHVDATFLGLPADLDEAPEVRLVLMAPDRVARRFIESARKIVSTQRTFLQRVQPDYFARRAHFSTLLRSQARLQVFDVLRNAKNQCRRLEEKGDAFAQLAALIDVLDTRDDLSVLWACAAHQDPDEADRSPRFARENLHARVVTLRDSAALGRICDLLSKTLQWPRDTILVDVLMQNARVQALWGVWRLVADMDDRERFLLARRLERGTLASVVRGVDDAFVKRAADKLQAYVDDTRRHADVYDTDGESRRRAMTILLLRSLAERVRSIEARTGRSVLDGLLDMPVVGYVRHEDDGSLTESVRLVGPVTLSFENTRRMLRAPRLALQWPHSAAHETFPSVDASGRAVRVPVAALATLDLPLRAAVGERYVYTGNMEYRLAPPYRGQVHLAAGIPLSVVARLALQAAAAQKSVSKQQGRVCSFSEVMDTLEGSLEPTRSVAIDETRNVTFGY